MANPKAAEGSPHPATASRKLRRLFRAFRRSTNAKIFRQMFCFSINLFLAQSPFAFLYVADYGWENATAQSLVAAANGIA